MVMEHGDNKGSADRARILAETVGLSLEEDRLPALAHALDAALELLAAIEPLAETGGDPVNEAYDPAWNEGGVRV